MATARITLSQKYCVGSYIKLDWYRKVSVDSYTSTPKSTPFLQLDIVTYSEIQWVSKSETP